MGMRMPGPPQQDKVGYGGPASWDQQWADYQRQLSEYNAAQGPPAPEAYAPVAAEQMMQAYQDYGGTLGRPAMEPGALVDEFQQLAPEAYPEYDWVNASKYYGQYAPEAYGEYGYNYADQYQPYAATAYQFARPEVAAVSDVSGVPADIWSQIREDEEQRIRAGYGAQRSEVARQLAAGGGARAGVGAVLASRLGDQEQQAIAQGLRGIGQQQAMQEVGIAQQTQALQAQRAAQQAQLLSRTEEMQAQEIARKQGIDIDEARQRVMLYKAQQEATAGERQYTYEQAEQRAKLKTGFDQAYQEAKASEAEKAYKAQYGRAQDVVGLRLTEAQQREAELNQRQQAALSQAQLGQSMFSQLGSYEIQKEPETGTAGYQGGVQQAWQQYGGGAPAPAAQPSVNVQWAKREPKQASAAEV